ncbi:4'-phosphopantetheinyl transferase family protein [Serratia silvae]|uniref:4'-phosphopantetheinyl transferase family protein n=1 Tax=Serratia silvae TaxID=2824122 RepID=UPI00200CD3F5|nr:4'-phosphopantetheinyl transferase superfamily protein [Serratia silvae]
MTAREAHTRLVGVDCEHYVPGIGEEIAGSILSDKEQRFLALSDVPLSLAVMIVFSAKESLYKALWPIVRRFFDFSAAEVCALDSKEGGFALRLTEDLSASWPSGSVINGRFVFVDGYITTLIL